MLFEKIKDENERKEIMRLHEKYDSDALRIEDMDAREMLKLESFYYSQICDLQKQLLK